MKRELTIAAIASALAALLGGEFNRRGRAARMIFAGAIAAAFQGLALEFMKTTVAAFAHQRLTR